MEPTLREGEVEQLQRRFPERIPVMVKRSPHSDKNTPELKKHKFLVPNHFTFGELIYTIRKWLTLSSEKAVYLFVITPDKKSEFMPSPSSLLAELHETNQHRNGVLYIVYALENTFGWGEEE